MGNELFFEDNWDVFNNSSAFQVYWRGTLWNTVEHAFQTSKFNNEIIIEEIKKARSPYEAREITKRYSNHIREDWSSIRIFIMEELLKSKLNQHPYVKKKLVESIGYDLINNSKKSNYWGKGPDGNGQNMHGKIWMELRDKLPILKKNILKKQIKVL